MISFLDDDGLGCVVRRLLFVCVGRRQGIIVLSNGGRFRGRTRATAGRRSHSRSRNRSKSMYNSKRQTQS